MLCLSVAYVSLCHLVGSPLARALLGSAMQKWQIGESQTCVCFIRVLKRQSSVSEAAAWTYCVWQSMRQEGKDSGREEDRTSCDPQHSHDADNSWVDGEWSIDLNLLQSDAHDGQQDNGKIQLVPPTQTHNHQSLLLTCCTSLLFTKIFDKYDFLPSRTEKLPPIFFFFMSHLLKHWSVTQSWNWVRTESRIRDLKLNFKLDFKERE